MNWHFADFFIHEKAGSSLICLRNFYFYCLSNILHASYVLTSFWYNYLQKLTFFRYFSDRLYLYFFRYFSDRLNLRFDFFIFFYFVQDWPFYWFFMLSNAPIIVFLYFFYAIFEQCNSGPSPPPTNLLPESANSFTSDLLFDTLLVKFVIN